MSAALQIVCSTCLALNQVPVRNLGARPICAVCRSRLVDDVPAELSPQSFERYVQGNHLPVLVEFWSPEAGSCLAQSGELDALARALGSGVLLARVNVFEHLQLAEQQRAAGGSVLVLYLEGRELARRSPSASATEIREWIAGA